MPSERSGFQVRDYSTWWNTEMRKDTLKRVGRTTSFYLSYISPKPMQCRAKREAFHSRALP